MDWVQFLEDNGIDYATSGPNTKRGEVSVKCPWCGEEDPSEHLGISLNSENWGCLRNAAHRGKDPVYLIAGLLGCDLSQANTFRWAYSHSDPDQQLGDVLAALGAAKHKPAAVEPLEPYPMYKLINHKRADRFWRYLVKRGFDDPGQLINAYKLTCCTEGRFKDRIIIPIFHNKELVAWTGRAITNPRHAPRYLSSKRIKTTVFNEEALREGGHLLFLVEGPFDAMKVDFYSRGYGARATCAFGTSISLPQLLILNNLAKKFDRLVVLMDAGALAQAWSAADWLHKENKQITTCTTGDPGDLTPEEVKRMAYTYSEK